MHPEEGTKAVEGAGRVSCEEQPRTLGCSCLERRWLRGNLTGVYNVLKGGRGKGPSFPWDPVPAHVGMAQSCAPQKRFRLDMRKHFFTQWVIKPWKRLLREVVSVLSWSVLKSLLDNTLNSMLLILVSPEAVRQLDSMIIPSNSALFNSI